jgi:hypothetical protein
MSNATSNVTINTIAVSNVAVSFPGGFNGYSEQVMTVACTVTGLATGQTPHLRFPSASMSTPMASNDDGKTWVASNQDTYAAETYCNSIADATVTFAVAEDGTISSPQIN